MFINKINMNSTGMPAMPITTEIISVSGKQNKLKFCPQTSQPQGEPRQSFLHRLTSNGLETSTVNVLFDFFVYPPSPYKISLYHPV